jgi:hypothetical protein
VSDLKANTPDARASSRALDSRSSAVKADVELLCAALNHDYIDGTLSDYYRDVRPTTALGRELRETGNASITPGRALSLALRDYATTHPVAASWPDDAMPQCAQLFEELGDLESAPATQ